MRKAGILQPIASLPSNYGIGSIGIEAIEFIDLISEMDLKIWQILPINPLGYGNSPYQPFSSFAGEPNLISIEGLVKMGLILEVASFQEDVTMIDYQETYNYKLPFLKQAYDAFLKDDKLQIEYLKFEAENQWVINYGVFIALKQQNNNICWIQWPIAQRDWIINQQYNLEHLAYEIQFHKFLQFVFYKQWNELKQYANAKNIEIMGDIPIYVGIDSLDVWENQEVFLLDENKNPTHVAGVPPDYFSKTGQRWGNPLYNWEFLEKTQFEFWINRLKANAKLFDIIRIDHFRAFDTYWKIDASCETAIEGMWIEAPGYKLFDSIYEKLPDIQIVAEDLGDMRPEVFKLRDHYKLRGMKIVQFTFDPNETNNDFEDKTNMMIYTGTHDNQTMLGWFESQELEMQLEIVTYLSKLGYKGNIVDCFLQFTFDSIADIAIIPTQDLIGFDDTARINTPGTLGNPNWQWKLDTFNKLKIRADYIKHLINLSKR